MPDERPSLPNLPPELMLGNIFARLSDKEVFSFIAEHKKGAVLGKQLYKDAIFSLFGRPTARRYQEELMLSWIRALKVSGTLTFIRTQQELNDWLDFLNKAKHDPQASFTYQVAASLLMTKIILKTEDAQAVIHAQIELFLLQKNILRDNFIRNAYPFLRVYLFDFSTEQYSLLLNQLLYVSMNERNSAKAVYKLLLDMMPHALAIDRTRILIWLTEQIQDKNDRNHELAYEKLTKAMCYADEEDAKYIIPWLMEYMEKHDWVVCGDTCRVLAAVVGRASESFVELVMAALKEKTQGDTWLFHCATDYKMGSHRANDTTSTMHQVVEKRLHDSALEVITRGMCQEIVEWIVANNAAQAAIQPTIEQSIPVLTQSKVENNTAPAFTHTYFFPPTVVSSLGMVATIACVAALDLAPTINFACYGMIALCGAVILACAAAHVYRNHPVAVESLLRLSQQRFSRPPAQS